MAGKKDSSKYDGNGKRLTGWDGSPLNEKDRKFYDLRESGYKGWIDQDGNAVDTERPWSK